MRGGRGSTIVTIPVRRVIIERSGKSDLVTRRTGNLVVLLSVVVLEISQQGRRRFVKRRQSLVEYFLRVREACTRSAAVVLTSSCAGNGDRDDSRAYRQVSGSVALRSRRLSRVLWER